MYIVKRFLLLFIILTGMMMRYAIAQDPGFSQFYANPLFLNPALAGNTDCGRLNLNYRNQWPAISNAFITYNASYDQNLAAINSGVGLSLMNDMMGDGAYNRMALSGFYSYKLQVASEIDLSFGVKAAYYQEKLSWEKLIFSDQIDPSTGNISNISSETPPANNQVTAVDFGAGILVGYQNIAFLGVSADHLTEPSISFYENSSNVIPMKLTLHAGLTVNASSGGLGKQRESDITIQPNILYQQQGKFHQVNFGFYTDVYPFIFGAWYRHNIENADAAIVLVGISWQNFRFGYNYDFTLSDLGAQSGGAHEISIAWNICIYKEPKRRVIRTIKSPMF